MFAFEIANIYIGVRRLRTLLSSVNCFGEFFGREEWPENGEFRLGFTCAGHEFVVLEPYGDSSRYWIGPIEGKEGAGAVVIDDIEIVFLNYEPPLPIRLIGNVLSLNIRGLLEKLR